MSDSWIWFIYYYLYDLYDPRNPSPFFLRTWPVYRWHMPSRRWWPVPTNCLLKKLRRLRCLSCPTVQTSNKKILFSKFPNFQWPQNDLNRLSPSQPFFLSELPNGQARWWPPMSPGARWELWVCPCRTEGYIMVSVLWNSTTSTGGCLFFTTSGICNQFQIFTAIFRHFPRKPSIKSQRCGEEKWTSPIFVGIKPHASIPPELNKFVG